MSCQGWRRATSSASVGRHVQSKTVMLQGPGVNARCPQALYQRVSRRNEMADVKCIAPTRIGGTDILYAQGMRAGPWLFFTGHSANDFEHGLASEVAGKPGLPLGSPP